MAFIDINLLGDVFTDDLLSDVGASAFELSHDWFIKQDLVIRTAAAGGGTLLIEDTDYTLSEESGDLSFRVTGAVGSARNIYHLVTVINAAYQTGNLYFSGKYVADTNSAADMNDLSDLIALIVPPGIIWPYGGTSAPTGFLMCDGTSYLQADYAALFAVVGTAFGTADGTHFNVPDLRGRFLRGQDEAQTRDPDAATRTAMTTGGNTGDNIGSVQLDKMQGHWHTIGMYSGAGSSTRASGTADKTTSGAITKNNYPAMPATDAIIDDVPNGTPRTGAETRPLNAYVRYIIKT